MQDSEVELIKQDSNGKDERMDRTSMNMARCMIVASGLAFHFWGDMVEYDAYSLNRDPTNSFDERMSPMKVMTDQIPSLGEIAVFGSPCTVYRNPKKKKFAPRGQGLSLVSLKRPKGIVLTYQKIMRLLSRSMCKILRH